MIMNYESSSVGSFKTWKLLDDTLKDRLLRQIRIWWGLSPGTHRGSRYFPGPQPVSVERKDFETLKNENYWVSYKSDGVRYLMVFIQVDDKSYCILIDRKMDCHLIKMTAATELFASGTVLDGEIVENRETKGSEYIVYDATIVCGKSLVREPHSVRLEAAMTVANHVKFSSVPVKIKLFYPLRDFRDYVQDVVGTITHGIDGYIFTPENSPVCSGTHYKMFKWKEQISNTVDFHVEYKRRRWVLKVSRGKSLMETDDRLVACGEIVKAPCIVECKYAGPKTWTPVLIREDKTHPNNYLTYTKTLLNISENIQLEEFY